MGILKKAISIIFMLVLIISIIFNILFLFNIVGKTFPQVGMSAVVSAALLISILGFAVKYIRKEEYVKINIITSVKEFGIIFVIIIIAWVSTYFIAFLGYSEDIYTKNGSKILHNQSEFYDLDFDGIPEIITNIYPEVKVHGSGMQHRLVYKFYGDAYELIGILAGGENYERLYINPENKIISVKPKSTQVFEIKDKKIVYSPYIDSFGNDSFEGIKYDKIGGDSSFFIFENYSDYLNCEIFLADLNRIPQFEYSDVLDILNDLKRNLYNE